MKDKVLKQSQFVALVINARLTDNVKLAAEWYNKQKDRNKMANEVLRDRFSDWMPQ